MFLQIKRVWRRYIYLWLKYAIYEELEAKDVERTREVYKACLEIIPHKKFTFAKVWLMFAQFEVRQKDLTAGRKILVTISAEFLSTRLLIVILYLLWGSQNFFVT